MGKKSKRRNNQTSDKRTGGENHDSQHQQQQQRNAKRTLLDNHHEEEEIEEETTDNLRFQDPFPDEFEEEVPMDDAEDAKHNGDEESKMDDDGKQKIQSWNPLTSEPLDSDTKLEIDESAYKMHHSLTPEWPALSFDILRDNRGDQRTRFPHSMIVATGSQADRADRNRLTIMKMIDLARTGGVDGRQKGEKELEDEILGEEIDKGDNDVEEDEDENIEDNEEDDMMVDLDPVLEHFSLKHNGGINRVRAMPQATEIVATWSDRGEVNLYNIRGVLDSFDRSSGATLSGGRTKSNKIARDPFFIYQGHSTEGYAMNWSPQNKGHFATGDCSGHIHLWEPSQGSSNDYNNSSFKVTNAYGPSTDDNLDNPSVEDIQWSPTENTVFAAAECGGYIKIYDTRCHGRSMLSSKIHENASDVNVIGWNPIVSNLLASGGDDGVFSVWDLRNFQSVEKGSSPQPLARFTCHQKPITSLEWHPSDESMIVVSDEDGTYIYDLSIEEDEDDGDNVGKDATGEIPPQLLFVHCGSESTKEVHWHPQITSCIMTTALSGYSVFIPSNL